MIVGKNQSNNKAKLLKIISQDVPGNSRHLGLNTI